MAQLVAPVLPPDYNPMETLFKGYAAVASINNRKKALALEAQQMAENEALRNRQLDIQRHGQDLDYRVASAGQKALAEDKLFKLGRTKSQLEAATSLTEGIRTIKAPINSQEWRNEAFNQLLNNPDAEHTPVYRSIYEQVKPRAANTNLGQKAYNGLINNLGIDKDKINQALENPQNFTKVDPSNPGKIGIHVEDSLETIPILDKDGKPTMDSEGKPISSYGGRPEYKYINTSSWEALKKFRDTYGDDDSTGKELDQPTRDRIVSEIRKAHPDWDDARIKNESIITARRNGYDE